MSNPASPGDTAVPGDGATAEEDQAVAVPEYERDQYLPLSDRVSEARRAVLREKFGWVRTYFKSRPGNHWKLQRKLNQARFGTTYDVYLTRTVAYAAVASFAGIVFGVLLTLVLSEAGVLAELSSPYNIRSGFTRVIAENRVVVAGVVLSLLSTLLLGGLTWFSRYYYPHTVADSRKRNINIMLPHAIVYMYALSFGGMDLVQVLRRMAEADETYGEVANEFDMVVRDVELFGNDLFTALRNARNLTPSDNLEQFFDDMLSVLDSGGDITEFLRDESQKYMDEAQNEQETFLETLATLSEFFIVAFVAGPLFLIVTLMMMAFLGASTILPMVLLIYAVLPLVMAAFVVVVSVISEPYKEPGHGLDLDRDAEVEAPPGLEDHPGYRSFRRIRRRAELFDKFKDPVALFKRQPPYVLLLSVPAALVVFGAAVAVGLATPSLAAFRDRPLVTTAVLVGIPLLVAVVPLSVFHEMTQRRKSRIAERLPDTLDILASANQMGIRLVEGLELVTRNITGSFAEELRQVRNDIRWNHDIRAALLGLADRLEVPQLTRTCKILAEGSRSTGDLHRVLSIAAEDTRHRYRLERNRQQQLNSYVAIVVIGFLVYLGVIVVINASFLSPLVNRLPEGGTNAGPVSIGTGDLALYNMLFFHSAIIQAFGTGLIAGKLTDNSVLSGLKYSIGLLIVALGVFAFI